MTLHKLCNFFKPQFSHLYHRDNDNTPLLKFYEELNKKIHIKCLANSKCSLDILFTGYLIYTENFVAHYPAYSRLSNIYLCS